MEVKSANTIDGVQTANSVMEAKSANTIKFVHSVKYADHNNI
jgi:hypothetical protein